MRINSVRQKEAWTQAAKAAGMSGELMSKAETGWTKAEGKCQAKERKAERENESSQARWNGKAKDGKHKGGTESGGGAKAQTKRKGKAKRGRGSSRSGTINRIQFPVVMARGSHLFPYRTQKLSLSALMVLGWKRPGRVGRRRIPI